LFGGMHDNMKNGIKFVCVFITVLFLVPAGAVFANNNVEKNTALYRGSGFYTLGLRETGARTVVKSKVLKTGSTSMRSPFNNNPIVLLDDLDQSQEQSDNYYKLYGDRWFAQSFIPGSDKSKLTKVEILINKHVKKSSLRAKTIAAAAALRIRGVGEKKPLLDNKLGSITLEIRETLDGRPIADRTLNPDEIPKNGDGEWVVFDVSDVDLWIDHTYYIVIHASGGDESNYYRWYFAGDNPYGRGIGFSSYDNGTTWNNEPNNDFCFKTYGELSDELPDGKTEYWALLVGVANYSSPDVKSPYCDCDAIDFKSVLVHHGWQSDHIRVLVNEQATGSNILEGLQWLDEMADQDDLVIYFHSAHGSDDHIRTYEGALWAYELDLELLQCGAENILVVLDCCESGGFIPYLKLTNRVILTSSKSNEYGTAFDILRNGAFTYFLVDETGTWSKQSGWPTPKEGKDGAFARKSCDTDHDGWISAEEAYAYAAVYTPRFVREQWGVSQHPQIYDGCPGELKITKI